MGSFRCHSLFWKHTIVDNCMCNWNNYRQKTYFFKRWEMVLTFTNIDDNINKLTARTAVQTADCRLLYGKKDGFE